jgi:hypothetical protein
MSFSLYSFLSLALTANAMFVYFLRLRDRKTAKMLPPGPPRDPIIGHLRYLPTAESASVFHEWAKTYGTSSLRDLKDCPELLQAM